MERYDLTEERDEIYQYESEKEDADSEDNFDQWKEEELFTEDK